MLAWRHHYKLFAGFSQKGPIPASVSIEIRNGHLFHLSQSQRLPHSATCTSSEQSLGSRSMLISATTLPNIQFRRILAFETGFIKRANQRIKSASSPLVLVDFNAYVKWLVFIKAPSLPAKVMFPLNRCESYSSARSVIVLRTVWGTSD